MKIGIYGGTFNPPHLGHLAAAKTAIEVLGLTGCCCPGGDPAPQGPARGYAPPGAPSVHGGENGGRAAAAKVVQVSTLELEREGKSYTSDTLEELHRQYPEAELWLLMGTDMFLTLHLWHDPDSILRLAGVCAFGRTEQDGEELFAPQRDFLCERYGAKVTTITLPGLVDISSTRLRKLLGQGEGREYLLPAVYGHI